MDKSAKQPRGAGRPRMMCYNSLTTSVVCEWVYPDSNLPCGQTFTDMTVYTDHIREQHLQNPYSTGEEEFLSGVCLWKDCNFTSLTRTSPEFINHVLFHPYHSYLKLVGAQVLKDRKLEDCKLDSSVSNLLPPLEVELKCHWNRGECGVVFDSVGEFYRHAHEHVLSNKQLTCQWGDCSFKGRDHNRVNEHVRSHLKEKVVACPTCGSLFANNTKFGDHIVRQQETNTSLTCSFCSKVFSSDRLLRDHARRHVNTLQCPQCELTCQGPSRLFAHIRHRHMTTKPHECALCHKTFKSGHSLTEHIETHAESAYKCTFPDCTFMTSTTRGVERHVQSVHVASCMLYCCHVCSERFAMGRQLTKHLKSAHGFQLPPGHSRFRYLAGVDGLKRLQTVRLDDEHLVTPELNTYSASSSSTSTISSTEASA